MAVLATGGHTAATYAEAEAWLARDRTRYADGATHARPDAVADLLRHPEAPGPTGPFWAVAATDETVATYLAALDALP